MVFASSSLLLRIALLAGSLPLLAMGESAHLSHIEYSTVPGYFLQDDPATDPGAFDYAKSGFGLIDQVYDTDKAFDPNREKPQWARFEHKVRSLNEQAASHTRFGVLFLGRHGQGFHNVAEAFYGTASWDSYWSKLDGNGTISWADAHLTDEGISQAKVARDTWAAQMKHSVPLPEAYYTSPLDRCLATAKITFGDLQLPHSKPFVPTVKELLRETIGVHTCDRRSSKEYIQSTYPTYKFEQGFSPTDPLWDPEIRESDSARDIRLKKLLDDVFIHDSSTFMSFTAHGGAIRSILNAIGHRDFALQTGSVLPVFVRAETKPGAAPKSEEELAFMTSAIDSTDAEGSEADALISTEKMERSAEIGCEAASRRRLLLGCLGQAANDGDLEGIKELIEHNLTELQAIPKWFDTALATAVYRDYDEILSTLLGAIRSSQQAGSDTLDEATVETLGGMFTYAAYCGNKTAIRAFLDFPRSNIDFQDEKKHTALWNAVRSSQGCPRRLAIVEFLLDRNANTELADEKGRTPLWAAAGSDSIDAVELLLEAGANVHAADHIGHTPLVPAAMRYNLEIVQALRRTGKGLVIVWSEM
ncbi:phosphoglycerate mutase family protein [Arthroderma uncinatum]|uniref:phosphoglycerate mutase family protein n=1 Tax=Arthroderma uncinatum TaxID=74035 RepID=UPI00144ADED6|nr:phosphoglycerate mutase family protein [Arthroderma uncinatum]KAF3479995.1 phosphoglycerate mutase family protein [Arthroderma uncinatum]